MAMALKSWQNMGIGDRLVRGTLGTLLVTHSMRQPTFFRRWEAILGGALLFQAVGGMDPLLSLFGVSTRRGAENNIMNVAKQALPGQGIPPKQTEQSVPAKPLGRTVNPSESVREALTIQ